MKCCQIKVTDMFNEFSNKLSGMDSEIQVIDLNSGKISIMAKESSSEMSELNGSLIKVSDSCRVQNNNLKEKH